MSGIHYGISFEKYASWPAMNISVLKHLEESPTRAYYKKLSQGSTRSKDIGRAVHCAVLEPDLFNKQFVGPVPGNANSKEHKEAKVELRKAGAHVFTASEWQSVLAMAKNLKAHKQLSELLEGADTEVSIVWTDETTGLPCKARIDILSVGLGILGDIKTTKDTSKRSFAADFCSFGYHCQMAFYKRGLKAVGIEIDSIVIASVASSGAYEVELYTPEEALMQIGDAKVTQWLEQWAELEKSGEWFRVQTLTAPQWYLDKHTAEDVQNGIDY